jgi:hypothetical protein
MAPPESGAFLVNLIAPGLRKGVENRSVGFWDER